MRFLLVGRKKRWTVTKSIQDTLQSLSKENIICNGESEPSLSKTFTTASFSSSFSEYHIIGEAWTVRHFKAYLATGDTLAINWAQGIRSTKASISTTTKRPPELKMIFLYEKTPCDTQFILDLCRRITHQKCTCISYRWSRTFRNFTHSKASLLSCFLHHEQNDEISGD